MSQQTISMEYGNIFAIYRADGLDGQEDELEDVSKGKLQPPTDDEKQKEIDDKPHAFEHGDLTKDSLEDLEKKAGIRPM